MGMRVWKKTFGGSHSDGFYSIVQSGNDYVVAGFKGVDYGFRVAQGDLWVIKLNSNGDSGFGKRPLEMGLCLGLLIKK